MKRKGRPIEEEEVLKILSENHEEAKQLLTAHRKQLDALAEALVERETLDEQEILKVTGLPRAPTLETGKLPIPGIDNKSAGPLS
jgi:cell division protease FtsH